MSRARTGSTTTAGKPGTDTPKKPEPALTGAHADKAESPAASPASGSAKGAVQPKGEQGGPKGPEPTRYGDWEKGGRCFDF